LGRLSNPGQIKFQKKKWPKKIRKKPNQTKKKKQKTKKKQKKKTPV
jgi:hypothetical protein